MSAALTLLLSPLLVSLIFDILNVSKNNHLMTEFAVIYSFELKARSEKKFIEAWRHLTTLIIEFEDGLGSRLHRLEGNRFIAYAQWPSRTMWEQSGAKLPASAEKWRSQMRDCCSSIHTLYDLEVVEDLLIAS